MAAFSYMNADTTPTVLAARLVSQGYSPDEVLRIMKQNKIVFPTLPAVLNELIGTKNLTVELVAGRAGINPSTVYNIIDGIMNQKDYEQVNALLAENHFTTLNARD